MSRRDDYSSRNTSGEFTDVGAIEHALNALCAKCKHNTSNWGDGFACDDCAVTESIYFKAVDDGSK